MTAHQINKKWEKLSDYYKLEVNVFIDSLIKKESSEKKTKFGSAKGQIKISSDFDTPLDDFKEHLLYN